MRVGWCIFVSSLLVFGQGKIDEVVCRGKEIEAVF